MSVQKRCLSCAEEGGHPRSSEAIRGNQRPSEAIGEALREVSTEAIRGEQSMIAIDEESNQRHLEPLGLLINSNQAMNNQGQSRAIKR